MIERNGLTRRNRSVPVFFFFFCLTEVFMCVWLLILSGLDLDLCRWIKSLFLRSLQESLDCQ